MSREPFLSLPAIQHRDTVFGLTIAFAAIFGVAYAGASWLSAYVHWSVDLTTSLDLRIPFTPSASLIYLSITPVLCLAPFVLRIPEQMRRLFHSATTATLIGACYFVLLPVDATNLAYSAMEPSMPFRMADAMNLERNYFPSLHVALAMLCALAYGARCSPLVRVGWLMWVAAIAVSTVLTKQHFIVDSVAGALLALACWRVARMKAARSRWLHALEIELLCLASFVRFSRRHIRYLFISLALLWNSLPRYRSNRLLRTGFAFLQSIDDFLDGDRRSTIEPLELAERLVYQLDTGRFTDDDLSRLARAFREDLIDRGGHQALSMAIALMRVMQADRRRVLEQRLLVTDALRKQLDDTFSYSVDLMLLAAGSNTRSEQVPELIAAFGWCSTVRDLKEDLARGLINIPSEVMHEAQITNYRDANAIAENAVVTAWLQSEAARAERLLTDADAKIASLADTKGRRILGLFARSIRRYLARFPDRPAVTAGRSPAESLQLARPSAPIPPTAPGAIEFDTRASE